MHCRRKTLQRSTYMVKKTLIGTEHERMFFDRWEIKLEGLTHERLHEWMKVLENVDIKVDGIPFHIYSES